MIYSPYVLIKLFQHRDPLKKEGEKQGRRGGVQGSREKVENGANKLHIRQTSKEAGGTATGRSICREQRAEAAESGGEFEGLMSLGVISSFISSSYKCALNLTCVHVCVSVCVCVCVCSQLDYNHISCIEDGAFRALRDLEVL